MTAPMTRKAFCVRLTGASVVLLIQACGGGGSGDTPAAPGAGPVGTGCTDTIAANHGHVLTIAAADPNFSTATATPTATATDKVCDIQGSAVNNQSVTLTVANLRALKAGTMVNVVSFITSAHEHGVSIQCA